jgi:hypothetical protein
VGMTNVKTGIIYIIYLFFADALNQLLYNSMNTLTIFYIFLAILVTALLVYYQYYFKVKRNSSTIVLSILRFLSILFIFLLLINPKILKKNFETIKPKLMVAIDNSASIKFAGQDSVVRNLIETINSDTELNNKFDIDYFSFGDHLQINKTFSFQDAQTNINEALKDLNELVKQQTAPIILISDGNQTYGNDYKYFISKQAIYPILIGDTIQFSDLEINQINVNAYTYLNNNFPVEVFISYLGKDEIYTKFVVEKNNKIIYSQKIKFSNKQLSEQLQFKLPANQVGKHLYKARVETFKNEKNTLNNIKYFDIEVIDEQTNVAIIYDIIHPDIGMLKRTIETNKQRKVNLINLNEDKELIEDNDIFILYQPDKKFQSIVAQIKNTTSNVFIITGNHTDWNFLNKVQDNFKKLTPLNQEAYYPVYNKNFSTFYTYDIGFADFPPLEDSFGEIQFYKPFQTVLNQKINGINTTKPLLVTFSDDKKRNVVLFGENSWKWRVISYKNQQSFKEFDQFFNGILQFLSVANTKNSLELNYKPLYYANEPVKITAKSYDSNLNFDLQAQLDFKMDGDDKAIPFYRTNNNYEVQLSDLKTGEYNFLVINKMNGERRNGTFSIVEYAVEQELLNTNVEGLVSLAINSNGQSFYPSQLNDLRQLLLSNQQYTALQKENKKMISLIDWKWLLGIIVLSLSLEWLLRKYRGLI